MKQILLIGVGLIVIGAIAFFVFPTKTVPPAQTVTPEEAPAQTEATKPADANEIKPIDSGRMANPETPTETSSGKLKVGNFTGTLQKVDTSCFSDGECYVEVDGKHITAIMGWSQAEVGSVLGVDGFGDLEKHIGEEVEVYAKDNMDGTYTLYGSNGFYIKLK